LEENGLMKKATNRNLMYAFNSLMQWRIVKLNKNYHKSIGT